MGEFYFKYSLTTTTTKIKQIKKSAKNRES